MKKKKKKKKMQNPCVNCAFPQNFQTRKLDEITVFNSVSTIINSKRIHGDVKTSIHDENIVYKFIETSSKEVYRFYSVQSAV